MSYRDIILFYLNRNLKNDFLQQSFISILNYSYIKGKLEYIKCWGWKILQIFKTL